MVQRTTYKPSGLLSCFAQAKEVHEDIKIDKDAYSPGETIVVTGGLAAQGRRVALFKTTTLRTGTGSFSEFLIDGDTLCTCFCDESGEARLTIPACHSTSKGDIINLTYTLELDGHLLADSKLVLPLRIYRAPTEEELAEAFRPVKSGLLERKETVKVDTPQSMRSSTRSGIPQVDLTSPKSVEPSSESIRDSPKSVRSSNAQVEENMDGKALALPGAIAEP